MEILLRIQQGDTWAREIIWTDENNQPVNLTGAQARMQMRAHYGAVDVLLDLSSDPDIGGITLDPAGKINLLIDAEDTAALAAGLSLGVYDLKITFAGGVVKKLIWGNFLVMPEVTV